MPDEVTDTHDTDNTEFNRADQIKGKKKIRDEELENKSQLRHRMVGGRGERA